MLGLVPLVILSVYLLFCALTLRSPSASPMSFKDVSGNKHTETVVSALKVPTGWCGKHFGSGLMT